MAKILKRLLLLIPILFLFPKSVFADTIPIRFDIGSIFNSYFVSSDNATETATNNFYDTQFDIYLNEQQNFLNYFVYYDKVYDKYIFFFINSNNQTQLDDRSVYLRRNVKYWNAFNVNNIANSNNHFYILSNEEDTSYYNSIFNKNYNNSPNYNDKFYGYYYSFDGTELTYSMDLITNNTDRFEFVYIFKNDLYINDIKQEISSSPEEPEPEDPEEDIPVYNFNNNKYYVPNYEKGNCVEVLDKDTIRVFKDEFTSFYTDYYINSNYISKTGQVEIDYEKHCSTLEFTDIRYYGNDFPQILFITLVASGFSIGLIYLLLKRFRKR